jgi:Flp pilus assembly protein TadB
MMFERREQFRTWFNEIVEKFRQKGAVSPEKAMTPQELDFPPRFEEAMNRRLGRSGVFVEVNGKYYLSEERLKQLQEIRARMGPGWNPGRSMMTLRLVQLGMVFLVIILLLMNFYYQSWQLRIVIIAILVVWLLVTLVQIYYVSRARRRFSQQMNQPQTITESKYHNSHRVTVTFVGAAMCS